MTKSDFEWPRVLVAATMATFITFVVEQVVAGNFIAGYIVSYVGGHIVVEKGQWLGLIQPVWLVICITVTVALWGQSARAYRRHAAERLTKRRQSTSYEA